MKKKQKEKLRIIPLGGLHEIGKNLTAIEYGGEIILIDCGMSFPEDEMFGVDVVIPDFTYLEENKKKIKGLFITHGHEDHIGAIPYLLRTINVPIFGTPLPLALIQSKLDEHGIQGRLNKISAGKSIRLGSFKIHAIRTTHSIADSVCYAIDTPVGTIFHTGDFKIDFTPVDGEPIDLSRLAEIGKKGVLLMMADSTNAKRPGYTKSEKVVGETLESIFSVSKKRIIIATFSSNVHRIQKIVDIAVKYGRYVAVSGRSMENVVAIAQELGYLKIPKGKLITIPLANKLRNKNVVIITTGSQGEPMSALARMASSDHKTVEIRDGDQIILSSSPIPGNEKLISNVVNRLIEKGAEVIYSDIAETHVSGHACAEELKIIHSLIKPKYFMPVHGEMMHLIAHENIAIDLGMDESKVFLMENGDCLELSSRKAKRIKEYAPAGSIMVDGLGIGDVGNIVLRDRKLLSESGLIIIVATIDSTSRLLTSGPDVISRGFVYVRENEDLMGQITDIARDAFHRCEPIAEGNWGEVKSAVKDDVRRFIYSKTLRSPVILPIIMES